MAKENKSVEFETELITTEQKPIYHYLLVEKTWVAPLNFTGNIRRVRCTVNGKVTFPCSLMGNGKGSYVISINKLNREKAGLEPGDRARVRLVRDDSKYGLPMPAELREVLNQDPAGNKLFESMTNGRQRSAIYYVTKSKDIDVRIRNALIIVEHLKNNDGKIDEKKLYQELKCRDI